MIPDQHKLELHEWHVHGNLAFKFETWGRGTGAFVRGRIEDLLLFIRELHSVYSVPILLDENQNRKKLASVRESGKACRGDVICFKDDRITQIVRCDDPSVEEGKYVGNADYLELLCHEQYGGDYRGNPALNSSAMMVSRVLRAISSADAADQADHAKSIEQRPTESRLSRFYKYFSPKQ
ncbi:MAG: hypothetical protein P4M13_04745 [Alphaproteobacteria bacterium]|nr:hypothetical protein [Alphaproteobacteria bacterium]